MDAAEAIDLADRLLDVSVKFGDLGADAVIVGDHHAQDRRVVVGEEPAQAAVELIAA